MDKVYTCVCGGQKFTIGDGFIRCGNCQRKYQLTRYKRLNGTEAYILDKPQDFNLRIRKEE